MKDSIKIQGARVNNLKNISLEIPRNKLVVITGVSGSGKSSLAFDTLYAEGQRRYVESLSSYARMFLGRMSKPECDFIKGIPPAIAIEQKVTSRNPRSTVGTSTEIYEYLRLLFARVGRTFSPISGQEVKKHTTEDVIQCMLSHPEGERFMVLCRPRMRYDMLIQNGFTRLFVNNEVIAIEDYTPNEGDNVRLVVDRLKSSSEKDTLSRLTDSSETAFYEGDGEMTLHWLSTGQEDTFSTRFEADGMTFNEPSDNLFAFNSPVGACPECEGFGRIVGIDEQLVIPNSSLSLYQGAVVCWRGEKMSEWKNWFINFNAERGFPIHKPYFELTQSEKDWLWHGVPTASDTSASSATTQKVKSVKLGGVTVDVPAEWTLHHDEREWGLMSINAFFEFLKQGQYKIQNRVMLARYRGKTLCPTCHGTRLRPEANYVRIAGHTITQLVDLPVAQLLPLIDDIENQLTEHEQQVASRILVEIRNRLQFMLDVGLGYLTLNRLSNSLSGGESQRINLATSLGSSLVGSLYILDEPSIGLHSRDTDRLIKVLKQLRDLGNTVVVVEHDEEIMRAADWIIDIGPDAGRLGGQVVWQGEVQSADTPTMTAKLDETQSDNHEPRTMNSHTLNFLSGADTIPVPTSRRPWNQSIWVRGARANNLKGIDVEIPLNVMTVVTGVSGSGKSSLVRDIFYNAMKRSLDEVADRPGEFRGLEGCTKSVKSIEFIDQNPIGKSSRSNPVTYVKAWDEIRKLFAAQPLAQQMDYGPAHFSFNTEGGRCEECKGDGHITVEMQFMADLILECPSCHGHRFKSDLLEVRYEGQNVYDILNMTINQAIEFFTEHKQKKIVNRLKPLQNVGLGYIKLGQTSNTLSGGENQRVKLAYYLGLEKQEPTIFIFDEPTTGLHFHDIKKLLTAFEALIQRGHTLLIIEHNMDIIKCADHVIDLGPEGGNKGGQLVCSGTPEQVAQCQESYTGRFLKEKVTANA
ncbi:MAG: excinuclease ABC subunit UvrA [Bacteroidales bacterium]|nr:excinuclease ABC subunit UvrA [Bacteroidales bacterium]